MLAASRTAFGDRAHDRGERDRQRDDGQRTIREPAARRCRPARAAAHRREVAANRQERICEGGCGRARSLGFGARGRMPADLEDLQRAGAVDRGGDGGRRCGSGGERRAGRRVSKSTPLWRPRRSPRTDPTGRACRTGATRIAAPHPSCSRRPCWIPGLMELPERPHARMHALGARSISRPMLACDTPPSAGWPWRRRSSVRCRRSFRRSATRACGLPRYRGMTAPGLPSNPRTPCGYQRATSSRDSLSVCLPMASPHAIPQRAPKMRSCTTPPSTPRPPARARHARRARRRRAPTTRKVSDSPGIEPGSSGETPNSMLWISRVP